MRFPITTTLDPTSPDEDYVGAYLLPGDDPRAQRFFRWCNLNIQHRLLGLQLKDFRLDSDDLAVFAQARWTDEPNPGSTWQQSITQRIRDASAIDLEEMFTFDVEGAAYQHRVDPTGVTHISPGLQALALGLPIADIQLVDEATHADAVPLDQLGLPSAVPFPAGLPPDPNDFFDAPQPVPSVAVPSSTPAQLAPTSSEDDPEDAEYFRARHELDTRHIARVRSLECHLKYVTDCITDARQQCFAARDALTIAHGGQVSASVPPTTLSSAQRRKTRSRVAKWALDQRF